MPITQSRMLALIANAEVLESQLQHFRQAILSYSEGSSDAAMLALRAEVEATPYPPLEALRVEQYHFLRNARANDRRAAKQQRKRSATAPESLASAVHSINPYNQWRNE